MRNAPFAHEISTTCHQKKELRDTLRDAGSPMVGMLPRKNEIDQSCLDFIRQDEESATMKIRFAIVSSDLLAQVRAEIDVLLRAVNAGDMDGVDAATALLLKLTVDCRSINLSEGEWRTFLDKNPA